VSQPPEGTRLANPGVYFKPRNAYKHASVSCLKFAKQVAAITAVAAAAGAAAGSGAGADGANTGCRHGGRQGQGASQKPWGAVLAVAESPHRWQLAAAMQL